MLQVAAQVMQATPSSTGTASLPSMRVLRVKSVSRATVAEGEGKPCALLDSGATHALRKATSEEEWLKGELVKVALAGGQSITMRMNEAQTLLLPPTPDDGEGSKASIVPMGALVATLGYKMEWNQSRCKLIGRNGEEIKLKVRGGCPELSEAQALNLIARLEEDKLKSLNDTVIKSQGRIREAALRLKETWFDRLRRYANTGKMADAAQAIVEAPHHVNIPMQCFEGMAVETGDETLWTLLKELGFWNRRRRKQILVFWKGRKASISKTGRQWENCSPHGLGKWPGCLPSSFMEGAGEDLCERQGGCRDWRTAMSHFQHPKASTSWPTSASFPNPSLRTSSTGSCQPRLCQPGYGVLCETFVLA